MQALSFLQLATSIATFIKHWLLNKNSFECRSFYSETFSLALLQRTSLLDTATKEKLLKNYGEIDKTDVQFHWEFNNYALLDYLFNTNDNLVKKFLEPLTFKNTPCTNWTLLRSAVRFKVGVDKSLATKEAKTKIERYQLDSGLILDGPGVKSFQYHCFSLAMIGEIYESTGDEYFKESFLNGIKFMRYFILSNGEALYIGRGQNQSFGYGALIYILALAYKYTNDKTNLGDLELIINFLKNYRRGSGNFPLVMNGLEKSIPQVVDMQNPEFAGWYPYNNYFDYLSFMGFFIAKAYEVLKNLDVSNIEYKKQQEYRDESFIKIVKPRYEAVLSKPGGYWSNDLPVPYIVVAGNQNITPCYGGEQFQKSLYGAESLPLPFCRTLGKSIRWRSFSFFRYNTLWLVSPLGIMKRKFVFYDESVKVETKIYSLFKFNHIYLFLYNDKAMCDEINTMKYNGYEYSASGRLKKYTHENKKSTITIKINV